MNFKNAELLDDPNCIDPNYMGGIKSNIIQALKYLPKGADIRIESVNKYEVDILCDPVFTDRVVEALVGRSTLMNRTTKQAPGFVRIMLRRRVTQQDRDEHFDYALNKFFAEVQKDMENVVAKFSNPDQLGYNLSWYAETAMDASALHDLTRDIRAHVAEEGWTREGLLEWMAPRVREYEVQLLERQPWAQRSTSWSSNMFEQSKAKAMQAYRELYQSLQHTRVWGVDED